MGKFGKALMENISMKEMNINLMMEVKRLKETVVKKDKMIDSFLNGSSLTNDLIKTVNTQREVIKNGSRNTKILLVCVLVMVILVFIK